MGSFITKAIQAFSKTERAQRLKAAIKAYRDHGCLTTEPEQTPKEEESQATQWWDRELRSLDQVTDLPTPEETEAFFETLDFAMHDQGGASIDRRRA